MKARCAGRLQGMTVTSSKLGKERRFLSLTLTDTAALVENGKNVFSISFENGKVNSVRKS